MLVLSNLFYLVKVKIKTVDKQDKNHNVLTELINEFESADYRLIDKQLTDTM